MSDNLLHIHIIVPEREIFSADVDAVTIPGAEGEMTILPNHAPVITQLRPAGIVTIRHSDQKTENILVKQGFAEVTTGQVTILAQEAATEKDNLKESIQKWIEDAEKSDTQTQNGIDIPDTMRRVSERV